MTSCTYDMLRSACSVALETCHGASTILLGILGQLLWIIDILDYGDERHRNVTDEIRVRFSAHGHAHREGGG
jgi:hypothetical protein